jgi:hypothetical protein
MTAPSDVELTRALERCEVPNDGFPHAAHLRVAWVYLHESPTADEAFAHMATTLRRFAASVGTPEKYSDAMTGFWMYQLAAVRAAMPDASLDEALGAYPRLLDRTLHAPATRSADPSSDAPNRAVSGASA